MHFGGLLLFLLELHLQFGLLLLLPSKLLTSLLELLLLGLGHLHDLATDEHLLLHLLQFLHELLLLGLRFLFLVLLGLELL